MEKIKLLGGFAGMDDERVDSSLGRSQKMGLKCVLVEYGLWVDRLNGLDRDGTDLVEYSLISDPCRFKCDDVTPMYS